MPNRRTRFKALHRLAAGLATLFLLGGCAPIFERYFYISLETYKDAQVIQRARPTPGEFHWSVGEIPTLYEITRQAYTLRIEIDPDIFTPLPPAMAIRVQSAGDRRLRIEPDHEAEPSACGDWFMRDRPLPLPSRLEWVHQPDCDPPGGASGFRIRFNVVDERNAVVGEEAIPYTIKKDGFFMYYDAV